MLCYVTLDLSSASVKDTLGHTSSMDNNNKKNLSHIYRGDW